MINNYCTYKSGHACSKTKFTMVILVTMICQSTADSCLKIFLISTFACKNKAWCILTIIKQSLMSAFLSHQKYENIPFPSNLSIALRFSIKKSYITHSRRPKFRNHSSQLSQLKNRNYKASNKSSPKSNSKRSHSCFCEQTSKTEPSNSQTVCSG